MIFFKLFKRDNISEIKLCKIAQKIVHHYSVRIQAKQLRQ